MQSTARFVRKVMERYDNLDGDSQAFVGISLMISFVVGFFLWLGICLSPLWPIGVLVAAGLVVGLAWAALSLVLVDEEESQ